MLRGSHLRRLASPIVKKNAQKNTVHTPSKSNIAPSSASSARRIGRRIVPVAIAGAAVLTLAACGGSNNGSGSGGGASGAVSVDGSSTVGPLTTAAAELFRETNPNINVTVATSGTGGGFEKFCRGETDMNDASRAIKDDEAAACKTAGITVRTLQRWQTAEGE